MDKSHYLIEWHDDLFSRANLENAAYYLKKVPSTARFVLVSFYVNGGNHQNWNPKVASLNSSYRYGATFENILEKFRSDANSYYYRYIITDIESYNIFREGASNSNGLLAANMTSYDINGNCNNMNSSALQLSDQSDKAPVWGVFNLTKNQFVNTAKDEAAAIDHASKLSRMNPTMRFQIMRPTKIVYQPIQVNIEDLDAVKPATAE